MLTSLLLLFKCLGYHLACGVAGWREMLLLVQALACIPESTAATAATNLDARSDDLLTFLLHPWLLPAKFPTQKSRLKRGVLLMPRLAATLLYASKQAWVVTLGVEPGAAHPS
jgi:hypothetical protein